MAMVEWMSPKPMMRQRVVKASLLKQPVPEAVEFILVRGVRMHDQRLTRAVVAATRTSCLGVSSWCPAPKVFDESTGVSAAGRSDL